MKLLLIIYLSGILACFLSMQMQNAYAWLSTPKEIRACLYTLKDWKMLTKAMLFSWILAIGFWWKWRKFVEENKRTNALFLKLKKAVDK